MLEVTFELFIQMKHQNHQWSLMIFADDWFITWCDLCLIIWWKQRSCNWNDLSNIFNFWRIALRRGHHTHINHNMFSNSSTTKYSSNTKKNKMKLIKENQMQIISNICSISLISIQLNDQSTNPLLSVVFIQHISLSIALLSVLVDAWNLCYYSFSLHCTMNWMCVCLCDFFLYFKQHAEHYRCTNVHVLFDLLYSTI